MFTQRTQPRRTRSLARHPIRHGAIAALATASLLALAACSSGAGPSASSSSTPAKGQLTTIRVGYQSADDYGLFYVGVQKGWFKDAGLNVDLSMFADGTTQIAALIGGSIDVTLQGAQPALLAAEKNAAPIRFMGPVADAAGLFSVVSNPSITSIPGLKGKTVAVQTASAYDYYFQHVLAKYGMTESDVSVQNLAPLDGQGAFLAQKVDAVVPLATSRFSILQKQPDSHTIFTESDWKAQPKPQTFSVYDLMITTQPYATAHTAALQAFMKVFYTKIVPYVTGAKTSSQAVSDLVDWQANVAKAQTTPEATKQLVDAYGWYSLPRAQKTVASGEFGDQLTQQAKFFVATHVISSVPDMKSLLLPSLMSSIK